MDKLVYNTHEVAKLLDIGLNKVYELLIQNQLPHVRVGRRYLIPKHALQQWLEKCTEVGI